MPQHQRRSRTGCDECRRRHWKCNEAKPTCAYCQSVGRSCVYSRQISWGGRPFKKSRFGKCLDLGARAVSTTVSRRKSCYLDTLVLPSSRCKDQLSAGKDFIYTCSPKRTDDNGSRARSLSDFSHETPNPPQASAHWGLGPHTPQRRTASFTDDNYVEDSTSSSGDSFGPQSLAMIPTIPNEFRPLLDHFVHGMTISISCHKGIQDEICSTIVPMSMQVPHLLSAVLALAAAHRLSSGLSGEDCQFELMKGKSLKQLRSALDRFSPTENDQVLATTLILCMAEVISPTSNLSSWRSHLHGAATLSAHHSVSSSASLSSTSAFLRRKHQALQAIALACGAKSYQGRILTSPSEECDAYIDDLAGYSTNLLPIFEEINNLGQIQEDCVSDFSCNSPPGPPHFDCNSRVEHKSHLLFDRIRTLTAQRQMSRTQGDGELPWAIYQDLYLLDEAYHHMALLQVFRRGSLSVPLRLIEDSRQSILACLTALTYQACPCPGVAALPPLFVAGTLCTSQSDRDKVRSLLKIMWMNYGMGNVRSCQTVLQKWWKHHDESPVTSKLTLSELRNWQGKMEKFLVLFLQKGVSTLTWIGVDDDVLPY